MTSPQQSVVASATTAAKSPDLSPDSGYVGALRARHRRMFASDLLVVVLATLSATAIHPTGWYRGAAFFCISLFMLAAKGVYNEPKIHFRYAEWRRLAIAISVAGATIAAVAFTTGTNMARAWPLTASLIGFFGLAITREVWRSRLSTQRRSGQLQCRTIVVGESHEAGTVVARLHKEPARGMHVVHQISASDANESEALTTEVLAATAVHAADRVVVASSEMMIGPLNRLCRDLSEVGIDVDLVVPLVDIEPRRMLAHQIGGLPVLRLGQVRRTGWATTSKRTFDFVAALMLVVLLTPLLLIVAVAVRFSSHGPVIFRQQRVGQHGRSFEMFKFRTMVNDAESQLPELIDLTGPSALFKLKDDPRITPVGRLLRRASLDELPQLFNVLRGDMSLVGPRPALRHEMQDWPPELFGRLKVPQGITGLWQVSGRSETGFTEYSRLDLQYVDNWSLIQDVRILARTVTAVFRQAGAY